MLVVVSAASAVIAHIVVAVVIVVPVAVAKCDNNAAKPASALVYGLLKPIQLAAMAITTTMVVHCNNRNKVQEISSYCNYNNKSQAEATAAKGQKLCKNKSDAIKAK